MFIALFLNYMTLQELLCIFVTLVGSLPFEVARTISATSSKSGNDPTDNLEWMTVSFTLTSNDVRRPTIPDTFASGTFLHICLSRSL